MLVQTRRKVDGLYPDLVNKPKADKRTSHIPVLLLTALTDQ